MVEENTKKIMDILYNRNKDNKREKRYLEIMKTFWNEKVNSIQNVRNTLRGNIKSIEIDLKKTIVKLNDNRMFYWELESFESSSLAPLIRNGTYDPDEEVILRKIINKGDCILDIGASWGWYTILFASIVSNNGKVHSFEPVPKTYSELNENIKLNDFSNVISNCIALSDWSGNDNIYIPEKGYSSASLVKHYSVDHSTYECEIKTLDCYLKANCVEKVDFIKIDVEGAELSVIRGGSNILSSEKKPNLMIEVHRKFMNDFGHNIDELIYLLQGFSYNLFNLRDGKLEDIKSANELKTHNLFCIYGDEVNRLKDLL